MIGLGAYWGKEKGPRLLDPLEEANASDYTSILNEIL